MTHIHPFEAANLGKAPFRFVGIRENLWRPAPGLPAQPGGTCDYCGQGIRYEFVVVASCGARFTVGCDCIYKVEHKGSKLVSDAERAFKAQKRKSAEAALAARVAAVRETLAAAPALLRDVPHPAIDGKSGRDYVEWLLNNGGAAGRKRACVMVEREVR